MISLTPLHIRIIKIIIWLVCLYVSTFYNFQNIFFIVSGIIFIFYNLGKRKQGQLSAYSVFNKDFKKIAGTFDPQQMLTGKSKKVNSKIFDEDQEKKAKMIDQYFRNPSKYGNKLCYCQSGLKFKKCCLLKEKMQSQKDKQKIY